MSTTTKQTQQRLHNAHEHLRHDSTVDAPEIVREQNRRVELAQQRSAATATRSTNDEQYRDR